MGGGLQDFSVRPSPFGFEFETKGLGKGLDNKEKLYCEQVHWPLGLSNNIFEWNEISFKVLILKLFLPSVIIIKHQHDG